jgi:hypothetical protein
MKKGINKKIWALVLAFAMVIASVSSPATVLAKSSSSGKTQVVTKAKDDAGYTTTYKYNKKGLVSKRVAKRSYKDKKSKSDISETITTTFKYNKKNRISKETTTDSTKKTSYEMDMTTGKSIKNNLGTKTETVKSVTKYTYDKKGRAKKSVTTITTTYSGTEKYTSTTRPFIDTYPYGEDNGKELVNNKIVAGYNDENNKAGSVYYYTGALDQAIDNSVTTTTYKDNGNGTYNVIENKDSTSANYNCVLVGTDGVEYESPDDMPSNVKIAEKKVKIENPNNDTTQSKTEYQNLEKTVITSTYTYGKKKRVKKDTTVVEYTNDSTRLPSTNNIVEYYTGGFYKETYTDSHTFTSHKTDKHQYTTSYTYGKNGKAKKKVTSNNGVENSMLVSTTGVPNSVRTYQSSDGQVHTSKRTAKGNTVAKVYTKQVANGFSTVTNTYNEYTEQYQYDGGTIYDGETYKASTNTEKETVKPYPTKDTYTYKYDKNKNLSTYKFTGTTTDYNSVYNEKYNTPIYELWDGDGNLVAKEVSVTTTEKNNGKMENTLKSGTKSIKKTLRIISGRKTDRWSEAGYGMKRVTYTLKAKSLSKKLKTDAEAQQWAIQNGALNGFVGLSLDY